MAKKSKEPVWLDRLVVDATHLDQLREHGGLAGTKDENSLESALARPRNRWHYSVGTDVAELAAGYCWGIARNHPYRDGNKRIAFLCMAVFSELNGKELLGTDAEVVQLMMSVAANAITEEQLADWLRAHLRDARKSRARATCR